MVILLIIYAYIKLEGGIKFMLIVAINGSPDKNGNTAFLLQKVLESAKESGADDCVTFNAMELINELEVPFCTNCSNPCTGECYKGSKLEKAFETMEKADAIVIGSPSYFGTVSGQIKTFFDKTRKLRSNRVLCNKIAGGVTVGGSKYGGQETTMRALHDMMMVHGMSVVGDGHMDDDCGHSGVSAQRPASEDRFALKRARIMGKRLVESRKI